MNESPHLSLKPYKNYYKLVMHFMTVFPWQLKVLLLLEKVE